jgi:hypothetical protein
VRERRFASEILLPRPRDEVFAFFADAANLEILTPPGLALRIAAPPAALAAGIVVDYRLRVRGMPLSWRGRIVTWEPPRRFVDEQVRGPYRQWVHEHLFAAEGGATRVRDRVRYALPGGPLEGLLDHLLVRPELERIFAYRRERLCERFGATGKRAGPAAGW